MYGLFVVAQGDFVSDKYGRGFRKHCETELFDGDS
jgi:hypothetical protein